MWVRVRAVNRPAGNPDYSRRAQPRLPAARPFAGRRAVPTFHLPGAGRIDRDCHLVTRRSRACHRPVTMVFLPHSFPPRKRCFLCFQKFLAGISADAEDNFAIRQNVSNCRQNLPIFTLPAFLLHRNLSLITLIFRDLGYKSGSYKANRRRFHGNFITKTL